MKKEYLSPELELIFFSFESILENESLNVSDPENSGHDHNDDDDDEW